MVALAPNLIECMKEGGAFMDWYCVHIDHARHSSAVNATFCKMLAKEHQDIGKPSDCRIYLREDPDGGYSYFFSPTAAKRFETFVKFWEGFGCAEPTNLQHMEIILLE